MTHTDPLAVPLITALTARHTIPDLVAAHHAGVVLHCCYYPQGSAGPRKRWQGIPSQDQICKARTLMSAALGRLPAESRTMDSSRVMPPPDDRSPVGTLYQGYERCQSYKWTTDQFTRKPIPPNSLIWRDLHTGKVSISHPFLSEYTNDYLQQAK